MTRSEKRHSDRWARKAGFEASLRTGFIHKSRNIPKAEKFKILEKYVKNGIERVKVLYYTKGIKTFRAVKD